jgi:hypothetical protein
MVDKQNRVRRAYPRRSPAEVAQLVAEYESSGLSPSAFCRQKGMNRLTLEAYRLRQEKAGGKPHWGSVGWRWRYLVPVPGKAAEGSGLAVLLPRGCRIEISRKFDTDTLKRLLDVVERG